MLTNIRPLYFFISFAIGLLLVYVFHPAPTVVVKFPSPYNAGKITYEDKHDSCYKYTANKVACPSDSKEIKSQPLFEDFNEKAAVLQRANAMIANNNTNDAVDALEAYAYVGHGKSELFENCGLV